MSGVERALLAVKAAGRRAGVEVLRFNPTNSLDAARPLVLRDQRIDLVVDVGANEGQWARELRRAGYRGRIISFEPSTAAHARLAAAAAADPQWEPRRLALADRDGEAELHLAGNAEASSSLLEMRPEHVRVAPEARYVGAERVPLARLDAVALPAASALMLKLDVQGAEAAVLAGAAETLRRVRAVECELSLVELYAGQAMFDDLLAELRVHGLTLWALRPALADPGTGRLLQLDALFVRG